MPKFKGALDKAASVVDAAADKARDKAWRVLRPDDSSGEDSREGEGGRELDDSGGSSSHAEPLTLSRMESTALRASSRTLVESRTAADDPVAAAVIEDLMVRKEYALAHVCRYIHDLLN